VDRTNAERQRHYIQRLKARAGSVSNAADKAEIVALKQELAQAHARIAEQAGKIARLRFVKSPTRESTRKPVTKPADPDSDLARAKATIADLRRGLKYFQKRKDGKVDPRTFTIIHSRMHPDRVSDRDKKARYKVAFEVFGELEKALVDKEQPLVASGDWDAARQKPAAKKRQGAAPPRTPRGLPKL